MPGLSGRYVSTSIRAARTSQTVGNARIMRPLQGSFTSGVSIFGISKLASNAAVAEHSRNHFGRECYKRLASQSVIRGLDRTAVDAANVKG